MAQASPGSGSCSAGTAFWICSSSSSSPSLEVTLCTRGESGSVSVDLALVGVAGRVPGPFLSPAGLGVSRPFAYGSFSVGGAASRASEASSLASSDSRDSLWRLAARVGGREAVLIPPAVGKPSSALEARHDLYFVRGNFSLTSSIVINFFSLLRRCCLGMVPRSTASGSSPFMRCRLRWLYRKQYLTPTMILD